LQERVHVVHVEAAVAVGVASTCSHKAGSATHKAKAAAKLNWYKIPNFVSTCAHFPEP